MECNTDKLLREVVKFLELCQAETLKGKIGADCYYSLTRSKLSFVDDLLEEEKSEICLDRDLCTRLENIHVNNNAIYDSEIQVVGK